MRSRRSRRKRRPEANTAVPSITSLMDIVTIILVYFIKTFAVSPIEVQDPSVELPRSVSQETVENAIVIMITGTHRRDSGVGKDGAILVAAQPRIMLDDVVIITLDPKTLRVPQKYKEQGMVIMPLKQELLKIKREQTRIAELTNGEGFTGKVVVVADKQTRSAVIMDVLVTCAQAGFGDFNFVVVKKEA